jgi:hypothetical protein
MGMFALALAAAFTLAGASSAEAAKSKYKGTNHAKSKATPTYRASKSGGIITHKTRAQRAKPRAR